MKSRYIITILAIFFLSVVQYFIYVQFTSITDTSSQLSVKNLESYKNEENASNSKSFTHDRNSKQLSVTDDLVFANEATLVKPDNKNHIASSSPAKKDFVIGYCKYPQKYRTDLPVRENEWLAKFFGENMFNDRNVVFKPVLPDPEILPKGISAESKEGMKLLGLIDVDIRVCQFGSSEMIKLITAKDSIKNGVISEVPLKESLSKYKYLLRDTQEVSIGMWSHKRRIFWPEHAKVIVDKNTGKPVKPFMLRGNVEPWMQTVEGLSMWFETKKDINRFDAGRVIVYSPHLINSFGRRVPPNPGDNISKWASLAGPLYDRLEDIVLRPRDFDATKERLRKKYFATLVNGHCRKQTGPAYTEGIVIREIFTYALFQISGKPVNNIGLCPLGKDGAIKAGLKVEEREKLFNFYRNYSTIDIFREHKFSIVMENSDVDSYLSEKLFNGYAAASVPVFFGSGYETVKEYFNPKAMVFCDIPNVLTSEDALKARRKSSCRKILDPTECEAKFREELLTVLYPFFDVCIQEIIKLDNNDRLYENMISQNLVPRGRELSGILNGTLTGELVKTVYTVLGFDE